jgi:adenosine deaminase
MGLKNYKDHHFGKFWEKKHPLIICTDDAGLFETKLSNDLFLIADAYNLSEDDCFNLMMGSVEWIFDKKEIIQIKEKLIKFKEKNQN